MARRDYFIVARAWARLRAREAGHEKVVADALRLLQSREGELDRSPPGFSNSN
jgi:hypothetical protein